VPLTATADGSAATATLDLDALSATLSGLTRQTGLPTTGTMLVLVPSAGAWAGHATFTFDGVQLRPDTASLTQTRSPAPTAEANTGLLAPLGALLPTWPTRLGATAGLLALAAGGLLWLRQAGADPLRTRRVLQVAEYAPGPGRTVVDLPGAKDLARLADAESLPILAAPSGTGSQYVLDDGAVIYRYRPHGTEQPAALGYFADRVAAEIVDRIAYEFRAPLATISGYAEMLNDQIDTEPEGIAPGRRKMLAAIDRGVGQLHKMIDDVTVLAELDQPAGTAGHVTVDELVVAATRGVTGTPVTVAVDDGLPALVGDQGKLSWAIGELVAGIVATLTGNGMVGIHARHDGDDVALTITGHDPAAAPVAAGSPLAHAVAKAVIDQHGGTTTTTGRTTTVRLRAVAMPAFR
jgi:signal transduction histidine kinase